MRPNDGARLGRPVLHAMESLLDPLPEKVSAFRVVGVHRTRVDPRAGRDALLDELFQALDAALSRPDPVDENAVTLKRFFKEKDRVRLQPANPAYPPMYFDDVRIQGKLIGVIRRLD